MIAPRSRPRTMSCITRPRSVTLTSDLSTLLRLGTGQGHGRPKTRQGRSPVPQCARVCTRALTDRVAVTKPHPSVGQAVVVEASKSTMGFATYTQPLLPVLRPVRLRPIGLLPIRLLPVRLLPVRLLPVRLRPVRLRPVRLLPVTLRPVRLLAVTWCCHNRAATLHSACEVAFQHTIIVPDIPDATLKPGE